MPRVPRTASELSSVSSAGWVRACHQPEVEIALPSRNELTSSATVGMLHSMTMAMSKMCSGARAMTFRMTLLTSFVPAEAAQRQGHHGYDPEQQHDGQGRADAEV